MDCTEWLFLRFSESAPHVTLSDQDNYILSGVIDSFGLIELIEQLEFEYKVLFSQDDFQDRRFVTVAGLAAIVKEKLGIQSAN